MEVRYFGQKDGLPTDRHVQVATVDNRVVFCTRKKIYTYNDLSDTIVPYEYLNRELGGYAASDRIIPVAGNRYWCIEGNKAALFSISGGECHRLFSYDFSTQGAYIGAGQRGASVLRDSLFLICLDNGFALFDESQIIAADPGTEPPDPDGQGLRPEKQEL